MSRRRSSQAAALHELPPTGKRRTQARGTDAAGPAPNDLHLLLSCAEIVDRDSSRKDTKELEEQRRPKKMAARQKSQMSSSGAVGNTFSTWRVKFPEDLDRCSVVQATHERSNDVFLYQVVGPLEIPPPLIEDMCRPGIASK